MSGAIPPLPQYASMAWCSVKAEGKLYLYHHTLHPSHSILAVYSLLQAMKKCRFCDLKLAVYSFIPGTGNSGAGKVGFSPSASTMQLSYRT
jgi:hypothetical protein